MQEEFEREGGVTKQALAKYLSDVLPVMEKQVDTQNIINRLLNSSQHHNINVQS